MPREHARLWVTVWDDPDFLALARDAQRMFFALISQKRVSHCGVLDYIPARLAGLAADEDEGTVDHAVKLLEADKFVIVDRSTSELLIRSFVRHDGVLKTPNMGKAVVTARGLILSPMLRAALDCELRRLWADAPALPGWAGGVGGRVGGIKVADPALFDAITGASP